MFLKDFEFLGIKIYKDGYFSSLSKLSYLDEKGKNLVFVNDQKLFNKIDIEKISCVLTTDELVAFFMANFPQIGVATSSNPKESFFKIYNKLLETGFYRQKLKPTVIARSAKISEGVAIANSNVDIGENTVVEDGVIIKENVIIGNNCLIQSGTVLGSDCFEVVIIDGVQQIIKHSGYLIIEDNVTIQSGCTVSKGLFPHRSTEIKEEVVIADLVHIAHGVKIGRRTKIAAGVVVSGNVSLGENVWIGPGAVLSNGINIGNNAFIALGSVVVTDVDDGKKVAGNFAVDYRKFLKGVGRNFLR